MSPKGKSSLWFWGCPFEVTVTDRDNMHRFQQWAIAWMAVFVLASIGINRNWIPPGAMAWLVAVIPSVFAIATILVYIRFLREADELLRKIHLEALGLGFAAGAVFMMGYRLLERVGAPAVDTDFPFILMVLAWCGALLHGFRRYA